MMFVLIKGAVEKIRWSPIEDQIDSVIEDAKQTKKAEVRKDEKASKKSIGNLLDMMTGVLGMAGMDDAAKRMMSIKIK